MKLDTNDIGHVIAVVLAAVHELGNLKPGDRILIIYPAGDSFARECAAIIAGDIRDRWRGTCCVTSEAGQQGSIKGAWQRQVDLRDLIG